MRYETTQSYYTIAGRDLEREVVPLLLEERVGLLVWSPLAGGLLSGKFGPGAPEAKDARRANFDFPPVDRDRAWKCVEAMRTIARCEGRLGGAGRARLAAAQAVRDERHHRRQARRPARRQHRGDVTLSLSAEEIATLDAVSALPEEYPGWMLARQGQTRRPAAVGPDRD